MTGISRRTVLAAASLASVVGLVAAARLSGQAPGLPSTKNGDWTHYTADVRGSRYSPLDQINAGNFKDLEVAWRFKTDNLGTRPEFKLEGTPLMVKGVVYATGGTRRSVVALDAKSGEIMWVHAEREGARAVAAPRQLSGRGLSYWTDGKGDDRILYVTTGYRLVALNAKTGTRISSFGKDGIVDMKVGALVGKGEQIDLETGEIGLHSTPTVAKDVVIVGSSFREGLTVKTHNNTKGLVRAWDVRSGKLLWTFNTIPRPGEFGADTWEKESWAVNGNTGVWSQITVDEEAGLVYLPVEDPTSDLYGGHRPGNNLFGDSLVCVDLKTGQRKWFYQIVHHPIWDLDMPAAPLLADINVNGKPIKAVAQATKQGFLFVFDRITGQPIWPIEEKPVPQTDVPGEKTSPTQPIPTKPPPYSRGGVLESDLIDFTPELKAAGLEAAKRYPARSRVSATARQQARRAGGGVDLGHVERRRELAGLGVRPGNAHVLLARLQRVHRAARSRGATEGILGSRLRDGHRGPDIPRHCRWRRRRSRRRATPGARGDTAASPTAPRRRLPERQERRVADAAAAAGGGGGGFGATVQGLSIVKPPYGQIVAINLDRGDLVWSTPHGDTPDGVRNHPALRGQTIPKTGQSGNVGVVVTKTLVIAGDPIVTTTPEHPRGAMLRAYDKTTGKEVGAVWMPAQQSGSPMTYMIDGKQYIIVAVSGGNYSGEYIAYTLPASAQRSATGQ